MVFIATSSIQKVLLFKKNKDKKRQKNNQKNRKQVHKLLKKILRFLGNNESESQAIIQMGGSSFFLTFEV